MEPDEKSTARDLPETGALSGLLTALTPQRQKVAAYLRAGRDCCGHPPGGSSRRVSAV